MSMLRWDPFADVAQLREQVNRLFEQSLTRGSQQAASANTWSPAVDIFETDELIGLRMEVAGVPVESIDIQLTGDTLTIRGERKLERSEEQQYLRVERSYGPFQRAFTLGIPVDQQAVHAACYDGVLEITLPKRAEAKPRQVKISVENRPATAEIEG